MANLDIVRMVNADLGRLKLTDLGELPPRVAAVMRKDRIIQSEASWPYKDGKWLNAAAGMQFIGSTALANSRPSEIVNLVQTARLAALRSLVDFFEASLPQDTDDLWVFILRGFWMNVTLAVVSPIDRDVALFLDCTYAVAKPEQFAAHPYVVRKMRQARKKLPSYWMAFPVGIADLEVTPALFRDFIGSSLGMICAVPRSDTIDGLVRAIATDPTVLPILADAVETAGCTHTAFLNYLRSP